MVQGIIFVLAGAGAYGLLAPFMKLALNAGYSPAEVLVAQFILGVSALAGVQSLARSGSGPRATRSEALRLVLAGTSIGFTGSFYYLAVAQTTVSLAIVLLMQSVWIGIAVDAALEGRLPSRRELLACAIILAGTVLATGALAETAQLDRKGIVLGLLSAVSYAGVIWSSKNVANRVAPLARSLWMTVGGMLAAFAIALPQLRGSFDARVIWEWGWIIALLGTVLPTLLFNKGMPRIGVGLGMILSSAELPVAIAMAGLILGERFTAGQWLGVALILAAIALANAAGREASPAESNP